MLLLDCKIGEVLFAYLDGLEIGRGAGSQVWQRTGGVAFGELNSGTKLHTGNINGSGMFGFLGAINEARIYNRALSDTEIVTLADFNPSQVEPPQPTPSSLSVARLKLDETSETQIRGSQNDNDGTNAIALLSSLDLPSNPEPPISPVVVNPPSSPQKYQADNQNFNYDGRIDWQDPQAPALGFPGTSVEFRFTGTSLQIELSEDNWGSENYVDVYLDDNPQPVTIKLRREGGNPVVYDIAQGLEKKVHNAVIYKRNDYSTGEFNFHSAIVDGQLLKANPDSQRTIEIYGDSISSGIAVEYPRTGVQDPQGSTSEISNAYYSYGSILARDYDAEVSLVAQGGVPLVNGFGYWNTFWNNGTGGEAIYDKIKPLHDALTWDFDNYDADLVILAYGQNDSSTVGNNLSKQQWKERYKQMIGNLRDKHPDAYFIGMFPVMFHNRQWDSYITEAIAEYRTEYNDDRVFSLIHQQVTPGHPRISEQEVMADTLKEFIDGTLSENGFSW